MDLERPVFHGLGNILACILTDNKVEHFTLAGSVTTIKENLRSLKSFHGNSHSCSLKETFPFVSWSIRMIANEYSDVVIKGIDLFGHQFYFNS